MFLCLWWNTHEGHSWTAPYSGPGLDSGLDQRKDSGLWTLDHHRGGPWTRHLCFVYIREKRRAGGLRVRVRERLKYF